MPEVHADPEKLRQFAKALSTSSQQLQQLATGLQRSLDATGWRDNERARFETEFKQTVKAISQLSDRLKSEYAPTIQKKAEALERFRS